MSCLLLVQELQEMLETKKFDAPGLSSCTVRMFPPVQLDLFLVEVTCQTLRPSTTSSPVLEENNKTSHAMSEVWGECFETQQELQEFSSLWSKCFKSYKCLKLTINSGRTQTQYSLLPLRFTTTTKIVLKCLVNFQLTSYHTMHDARAKISEFSLPISLYTAPKSR